MASSDGDGGPKNKMAEPLSQDRNVWDQQPQESEAAYAAFIEYRDMEERKVTLPRLRDDATDEERRAHGSKQAMWYRNSAKWSWVYRARAWDRYVSMQEIEDLARYRSKMNQRHRQVARMALSKFTQWVVNVNPDTLKPGEAVRLLEVATRVEREASYANLVELPEAPAPEDSAEDALSLAQLMGGLTPEEEANFAQVLGSFLPDKAE